MEALLLLVTLLATLFTVYWSAGNDRRRQGREVSGLLAYLPGREPRPARPSVAAPRPPGPPPKTIAPRA